MKLKKLVVNNLFGHFNHTIPFQEEHITIITAPNGYGKTIVLKIIDAIFNKNFGFLCLLDFSLIELVTSEGALLVKKDQNDGSTNDLTISLEDADQEEFKYCHDRVMRNVKRFPLHMIDSRLPFLTRVGEREWVDDRSGELVDFDYIFENYSELIPDKYRPENIPDWLSQFANSLKAHFIQDQRLILRRVEILHSRKRNFVDTIEKYAAELSDRIRESSDNSSKISQQLDTTFPVRLLKKDYHFKAHTAEELKEQLKLLQKKREILAKYNLLSSEQHLPDVYVFDEITDADTKVLTLYVEDTKQKLEAYDILLQKIELFSSILNKKRLSFKRIDIDPDKGFIFETDKGRPLKLTQLSSGEQHQVVLLYELIFKTQEDVLVLIDEPEISLHVAWQKDFLDDLKRIIEIQNMVVVVATHSPQIINSQWNLVVDLEEGAYA
jgi:predicted ATP-binding protein involved in virulence